MSKPKAVAEIATPATLKQAAAVFQQAMQPGLLPRLIRGPVEFGRPHGGSPFEELDDDPPAFSVFAGVPTSRNNQSVIHLYGWDRGEYRELRVVAMGGVLSVGRHARLMTRRFLAALNTAAPGTRQLSDAFDQDDA